MNILFWKKEGNAGGGAGKSPYEELQEKKTTKLGYFLLFVMVVLGVWQGQGFMDSISRAIPEPQRLTNCSSRLIQALGEIDKSIYDNRDIQGYGYRYSYMYATDLTAPECEYTDLEKKFNIPAIATSLRNDFQLRTSLYGTGERLRVSKSQVEDSIASQKQSYSISLTEKMAGEKDGVYNKQDTSSTLRGLEQNLAQITERIESNDRELKALQKNIEGVILANKSDIVGLVEAYSREIKVVAYQRAILLFVLITPVFYFSIRRYFKYKKENSHYTIIWAAVSAIFALLFAQVLFGLLERVLPREFIERLILFFGQFAFVVTLLQYLLLFLVPIIFGGLVYLIQKKVYNAEATKRRAFKAGKCPRCEMKTEKDMNYCPLCSYQFKAPCATCGVMTSTAGVYCEHCGVLK